MAKLSITDELVNTPGVLSTLEEMITALRRAYADRGLKTATYGEVTMSIFHPDDDLRRNLRRRRDDAAEEVAETITADA